MTDLGFGMVDRRSVIITLFVFVLSFVLFKFPLPIDVSTVVTTFISLMILTGYFYITRSVFRFALIILYSITAIPFDVYHTIFFAYELSDFSGIPIYKFRGKGSRGVLLGIIDGLDTTWKTRFLGPLFIMRDWDISSNVKKKFKPAFIALGMLDRVVLVIVAFFATIPSFKTYIQGIGWIGILLITSIYVITGKFSFVLLDAMHKAELKRE